MVLSHLSDPAFILSAEVPTSRPLLRSLFENISRLSNQHVLWNYFNQRRDFLEVYGQSPTTPDPIMPQSHPIVASTLPIGEDDVLLQYTAAAPPSPPQCCSLIAPTIQGALEALMILSYTSGEDL